MILLTGQFRCLSRLKIKNKACLTFLSSQWSFSKSCCRLISSTSDSTSDDRFEKLSHFSFWQERYNKEHQDLSMFDWFLDSSLLIENIRIHLEELYKTTSHNQLQYLDLGCGNSELPLSVYRESSVPVSVLAMDYVINAAQQQMSCAINVRPKHSGSQFQALCGDVMKMPFKSKTFDIAVDKGTMDALLKNRQRGHQNSCVMFSEVLKSLRPEGRYIQISDEDPDSRLEALEKLIDPNHQHLEDPYLNNTDNNLFLVHKSGCENNVNVLKQYSTSSTDIHEKENLNIIHYQQEKNKFTKADDLNWKNSMCSPWRFKIITDDDRNKEYFIYWTEKS